MGPCQNLLCGGETIRSSRDKCLSRWNLLQQAVINLWFSSQICWGKYRHFNKKIFKSKKKQVLYKYACTNYGISQCKQWKSFSNLFYSHIFLTQDSRLITALPRSRSCRVFDLVTSCDLCCRRDAAVDLLTAEALSAMFDQQKSIKMT